MINVPCLDGSVSLKQEAASPQSLSFGANPLAAEVGNAKGTIPPVEWPAMRLDFIRRMLIVR